MALWLKLIALLHPAKPVVDALFNAHRLDWVLAGKYYFTQPFIGGVEMPYAIGLYVFASLWTWITSDHTALIRGVTAASDVAAGALLYPIVLRAWGQRRTAVLAVLGVSAAAARVRRPRATATCRTSSRRRWRW